MNHPEYFPVEINTADIGKLLRVPGIGPRSAKRIVELRRREKIKDIETLKRLGVVVKRAKDFILINGKRIKEEKYTQLSLISSELLEAG